MASTSEPKKWLAKSTVLLALLNKQLRKSPQLRSLFTYFRSLPRQAGQPRAIVLVQCVPDGLFYFCVFGQIIASIRQRNAIRVEQVVTQSLTAGEAKSIVSLIAMRLIVNPLLIRKWHSLYRSFCDGTAYRSVEWAPIGDVIDLRRAWICWRSLDSRKALSDLVIDGVPVGDLVNDSFLRFRPAPTINLKDRYLLIVLWQAYRDVRRARRYFRRLRPRFYFTSYSTYIQHGIVARVALKNGVRVFSFGNVQELSKELTLGDWVHTKNPDRYATEFAGQTGRQEKLLRAEVALSGRMSGTTDSATAYMRKSAYTESSTVVPDVGGAAVVFLHDFFDSPHIYREMVFPDFWDWACFTIDTLLDAGIRFFVKPHPNQVALSDGVLGDLLQRYPQLLMIPANVTNKQLADAGMIWAVTVYGSVAHEMAYLGVPTIACAHHPHVSFGFCETATSREQYAAFLRACGTVKADKSILRQQSLAFYYMHNLHLDEDQRLLRDKIWSLFWVCAQPEDSDLHLTEDMQKIVALPGYRVCIDSWQGILSSE